MRIAIIALLTSVMSLSAKPAHYTLDIRFPHHTQHMVDVELRFDQTQKQASIISMPVWTPGSYLVREFAKSVEGLQWSIDGQQWNKATKTAKHSWSIPAPKGSHVQVKYQVYARELSVRTSYVDADQALLNMASIAMFLQHDPQAAGQIHLHLPEAWTRSSTALPAIPTGPETSSRTHSFQFESFDQLVDCPIQIGHHEEFSFEVRGIPHRVAMVGQHNADLEQLALDMQRICETMTAIIDEHPCQDYLFIVQHVPSGGGGLEHASSTCLMMQKDGYTDADRYKRFLGLVAHEYFHLWNVKRIRPIELGPFDYLQENYTDLLWVAEGITSYYDELALVRAGYVDAQTFLNTLTTYIDGVENRPGSYVHSLAEVSRDAWIREYRPNENSANTSVSYYSKGLVVAAYLDAEIRSKSAGASSLDSLMRYLYKTYYLGQNRGFTPAEFESAVVTVAGGNADHWKAFFEHCLWGTGCVSSAYSFESLGLTPSKISIPDPSLGMAWARDKNPLEVSSIKRGSTAYELGLNVGDQILQAQCGLSTYHEGENWTEFAQSCTEKGLPLTLQINRNGEPRTLQGLSKGDVLQKTQLTLTNNWEENQWLTQWLNP
jgi:predicted metalloprotease with PDZ domain